MTDVIAKLEQAVALHMRGRSEEAVEIGRRLLSRARGTPHAARIYRCMSEFLLAIGNYLDAADLARQARSLAQATRHPDEILGSTLSLMACDLYQGEVATVYKALEELRQPAVGNPRLRAFVGQVMLTIGDLDQAIVHLEETRTLLEKPLAGDDLSTGLLKAQLSTMGGKTHLLADRPREAIAVLERARELELPTLVPECLARSLLGQALVHLGDEETGRELADQACGLARKISQDAHGQALAISGLTRLRLGEIGTATEQLRAAVGLLTHPLERQESFFALGKIARLLGEDIEAVQAYRRATEPTSESFFGRKAVRELKELVGFRVV